VLPVASLFCFDELIFKVIFSCTVSLFFIFLQIFLTRGNKKVSPVNLLWPGNVLIGRGSSGYAKLF
jgi:hypothetical protein